MVARGGSGESVSGHSQAVLPGCVEGDKEAEEQEQGHPDPESGQEKPQRAPSDLDFTCSDVCQLSTRTPVSGDVGVGRCPASPKRLMQGCQSLVTTNEGSLGTSPMRSTDEDFLSAGGMFSRMSSSSSSGRATSSKVNNTYGDLTSEEDIEAMGGKKSSHTMSTSSNGSRWTRRKSSAAQGPRDPSDQSGDDAFQRDDGPVVAKRSTTRSKVSRSASWNKRFASAIGSQSRSSFDRQVTAGTESHTSQTRSTECQSNRSVLPSFSQATMQGISLDGEALRGVRTASLMRFGARLLDSSRGSEATYALSEEVEVIHTFISHNWAIPRRPKFVALAVHFNLNAALCVVLLVSAVFAALIATEQLPVHQARDWDGAVVNRSIWALVFANAGLFATIFLKHEVMWLFGCNRHVSFLDKVCIPQHDVKLRTAGIKRLGAFLYRSQHMLLLYSDVFLQRLWTVYELATFLSLKEDADITVLPLFLPSIVLLFSFSVALVSLVDFIASLSVVQDSFPAWKSAPNAQYAVPAVFAGPIVAVTCVLVRRWARQQAQIRARAGGFSIRSAVCASEDDRMLVQSNVVAFLRDSDERLRMAPDAAVLDRFDAIVREAVPRAVARATGVVGIPYQYVMLVFLSRTMIGFDTLSISLLSGDSPRSATAQALLDVAQTLVIGPISFASLAWVAGMGLELRRAAEVGLLFLAGAVFTAAQLSIYVALRLLRDRCEASDGALAGLLLLLGALGAVTAAIYRPRR